ncbi:MAG: hypothetical protein IPK55_10865 [Streptococcus sp.]|nr:hypothetical protein [Streptococcus sp.]
MTAKEISQMRANQSLVNGMVEVSEKFGKADEGKKLWVPVVYDLELADRVLTFVKCFCKTYRFQTEYKNRTQAGLLKDAEAQCKA